MWKRTIRTFSESFTIANASYGSKLQVYYVKQQNSSGLSFSNKSNQIKPSAKRKIN